MNKKTKNPREIRFTDFKERWNAVKEVIKKPAPARVFFLILDEVDYTKAIADAYYKSGKHSTKKEIANPKVISIYLTELRKAGIIKKKVKKGKIQRYEPDWEGIFDILCFTKSVFQYAYNYSIDRSWNGEGNMNKYVKDINYFFIKNFLIPYFETRKEQLKLHYHYLESKDRIDKKPLICYFDGLQLSSVKWIYPKNYDNVDFPLKEEFKKITSAITDVFDYEKELVNKLIKTGMDDSFLFNFFYAIGEDEHHYLTYFFEVTCEGKTVASKMVELVKQEVKENGARIRKNKKIRQKRNSNKN